MAYDVLYYWRGDAEAGIWLAAEVPDQSTAQARRASLERSGYVAVLGRRSIGPPEGPPSAERLAAVGGPSRE